MRGLEELLGDVDLSGKVFCYQCVLAGMDIRDALYDMDDVVERHGGSDLICSHCYQTEEEFGVEDYSAEDVEKAFEIIREFEDMMV